MQRAFWAGALGAVALIACGPSGGGDGAAEAQTSASAAVETHEAFVARCTRETIASNPQSRAWAEGACEQNWEKVSAAGPLAEAILAAAPPGAGAVDLEAVRGRLTQVRWSAAQGGSLATGQLGTDLSVNISRAPPSLAFQWGGGGDIVPYDVVEALKGRGATLTQIACMSYGGPFDVVRVYNVAAPGRAPFGLSVYAHDAAMAGAYTAFVTSVYLTGAPATLASVRANAQRGEEWSAACPS